MGRGNATPGSSRMGGRTPTMLPPGGLGFLTAGPMGSGTAPSGYRAPVAPAPTPSPERVAAIPTPSPERVAAMSDARVRFDIDKANALIRQRAASERVADLGSRGVFGRIPSYSSAPLPPALPPAPPFSRDEFGRPSWQTYRPPRSPYDYSFDPYPSLERLGDIIDPRVADFSSLGQFPMSSFGPGGLRRFASGGMVGNPEVQPSQSPYPSKPYESMADVVADKGRYGDSMMMHVSPGEVAAIDSMVPGGLPRNPETGQPEAFLFTLLGMLDTKAAAGIASLGTAGTVGGVFSSAAAAIPKVLGSTLTGFGKALGAAGVPTAGKIPAGLAKAFPALAKAGGATAGNPFLQTVGQVGSGLGQVAGLPVEVAGKVLGTHQGGGGLGEFFGGGGGAPPDPSGLPADASGVQPEAVAPSPSVDPSSARNVLEVATDATSNAAEAGSQASEVVVDTAAEGGWTTGDKIGAGLLGAQFLNYVIPQDDDDPYGGESSYEGPSSWSGRTYSGGTGGGRSGERSYYTGRVG